jgi:Zn-dependent protease with chaperone function
MRNFARRLGRKWILVVAIYLVLYLLLDYLLSLPLSYYQGFVRQHAYDLSNQTFAKWFGDSIKGLFVGVIAVVLFGWFPFLLLKKSPRRWWLYTGLAAIPFLFFLILVTPIWVSPMFNDFGPMEDRELEAEILALAERAGIEGGRVFQVNKSVDTEAVNAYVTGFLNTKRIVLWDTIIDKLDREELLFVMGHEMGHYVLKHVITSIFFFSVLIIVVLYAIYRSAGALIARYRERFGFESLDDVAALPLILLLVNVYFFVLAPVAQGFSRYHERESDRFGLELTQRNRPAATAFVKLQQENLGNPRPGLLFKLWRATHPPLGERIDFCNDYRPWETGGEMRYADRFAEAPPG